MKRVRDRGGLMRDCGNDTEVYGTIINVPLIFFDFSTIRVGKCLWKKNLKNFYQTFSPWIPSKCNESNIYQQQSSFNSRRSFNLISKKS